MHQFIHSQLNATGWLPANSQSRLRQIKKKTKNTGLWNYIKEITVQIMRNFIFSVCIEDGDTVPYVKANVKRKCSLCEY
jgi:hypothetical protein